MYAFLFDRRSMTILLLVLTIGSLLLFASGVVVGTGFTSTRHSTAELAEGGERQTMALTPDALIDLIAGPSETTSPPAPSVAGEAPSAGSEASGPEASGVKTATPETAMPETAPDAVSTPVPAATTETSAETSSSGTAPRTQSPDVSPTPSAENADPTPSTDAPVPSAPPPVDPEELVEPLPAVEGPVAASASAAEAPTKSEAPAEEEVSGETVWASYEFSGEPNRKTLTTYSVQVGAYGQEPNARRHMLELEGRGFDPYSVLVAGDGRWLHTVRIGRFESRAEAERAAEEYRVREGGRAFVRTDSTGAEL